MDQNGEITLIQSNENELSTIIDRKVVRSESLNGRKLSSDNVPQCLPERDALMEDLRRGLFSFRAMGFLSFWYFFSFTTLFLNKYILAYLKGDPTVLGSFQLLTCGICGYFQNLYPCGLFRRVQREKKPPKFFRNLFIVGNLRFSTVLLGLIALWYVPVSFAETVKSTAPVFTVIIAWLLIGEQTSWLVVLSLFPIMGGLALCSANELHFDSKGFIAALATNLSECLQNVFSKLLLSGESFKLTAAELQFYTSISSIGIQIPSWLLLIDLKGFWNSLNTKLFLAYILGGISFHCQSLSEYMLLGYVSPVTHSVANTAKRALLIWLSFLTFGNPFTFLSALGTIIVILGVLLYNKAHHFSITNNPNKQNLYSV